MYHNFFFFFLISCPINHLMIPQIYFVTLRLGTTGLNYITVYEEVKISSTSSSYNSKMLLTY